MRFTLSLSSAAAFIDAPPPITPWRLPAAPGPKPPRELSPSNTVTSSYATPS